MKENRSLAISNRIQECKIGSILGMLETVFPSTFYNLNLKDEGSRSRIFTPSNTLLTMVLTATQQDKTLKNSVNLFYTIHQKHKAEVVLEFEQSIKIAKAADKKALKTAGRPKKYNKTVPKCLTTDISLNTAAYSKARDRVPVEMVDELFNQSKISQAQNNYSHWNKLRVLLVDGTYIQMQDTAAIRKQYEVKHKGEPIEGYPQGLLEVVLERGTGQVFSYKLSNRHTSELALFYDMLDEIPPNSLLLLDDLYNCYEIINKCIRLNIEFVIPAKRERNYSVLKKVEEGDEIIEIQAPKNRSKWLSINEKAMPIKVRKMRCNNLDTQGGGYELLTSILDEKITKNEFQLLYLTRWDIEIGIREIKTIMDVNILRSKTPEMALKELAVSLSTYNLLRKILYASIKDLPFSPKENLIYRFYTFNQDLFIDKKGRVYNRWSSGRRRAQVPNSKANVAKKKTK